MREERKNLIYGDFKEKETKYDIYSSQDSKTQIVDLDGVSFRVTNFPDLLVVEYDEKGSNIVLTRDFNGHFRLEVESNGKKQYYKAELEFEHDSKDPIPVILLD